MNAWDCIEISTKKYLKKFLQYGGKAYIILLAVT